MNRFSIFSMIALLGVVLGCDPITGMKRKISPVELSSVSCIEEAGKQISNAECTFLTKERMKRSFDSYLFSRGNAHVELQLHKDANPELSLGFLWLGFPDKAREEENLQLLNEIQDALFRKCGLSMERIKIVDECIRMECPK